MKNKPLISVIMAAYNSERFIGEAIASVIYQTYKNWELIIVDDCSTDNTATEIKKYTTGKQIIYLKNDGNKGAAYSRNRAISAANGEFLAILDADDYALPLRFATQVEFLNAHACIDAAGSFVQEINETGKLLRHSKLPINPQEIACSTFFVGSIVHSSAMLRRDFFLRNNLFYDETFPSAHDYEMWSRAIGFGKIYNIPRYLTCYRYSEMQISSAKKEEQIKNAQRITAVFLEKLGFTEKDKLLELHSIFVNQRKFNNTSYTIKDIVDWAVKIYEANKKVKLFPVRAFANELILRFMRFCFVNKFSYITILKKVIYLNIRFKGLFFPYFQLFDRISK